MWEISYLYAITLSIHTGRGFLAMKFQYFIFFIFTLSLLAGCSTQPQKTPDAKEQDKQVQGIPKKPPSSSPQITPPAPPPKVSQTVQIPPPSPKPANNQTLKQQAENLQTTFDNSLKSQNTKSPIVNITEDQKAIEITAENDILFNFDKYNIKPKYNKMLEAFSEELNNDMQDYLIIIKGYTDSTGKKIV